MAEITRPGSVTGVRLIDFATVLMGPCATRSFDDLGPDVIKLDAPRDTLRGQECESISKLSLGESRENPQVQEQLIDAVDKTYRSRSHAELSKERDSSGSPCQPH